MNEEHELREDARATSLLSSLTPPSAAAVQRVRARLDRPVGPTLSAGRILGLSAATVALAATALLGVRQVMLPPAPPPAPVSVALEASGWATHTSVPDVGLSFEGVGAIAGTEDAPRIHWETGTLNVEVTPEKGVRLAVTTAEAEVRVVGTGFTVERDRLGTRVLVRHGRVEVDCGTEVTRVLEAGDEVTCAPRTAAGLLGRALALQAGAASPETILATLDAALVAEAAQPSITDEISARRIGVLVQLGRDAEALEAARSYLERGGARGADVTRMAAVAASRSGGCVVAAPWLDTTACVGP